MSPDSPKDSVNEGVTDSDGTSVDTDSFHPNDNLVDAIVRAWTDDGFRTGLLSFPKITRREDWRPTDPPNYANTQQALAAVGVYFERPVVLTRDQYKWGYKKKEGNEVVFVLPDPPGRPEFLGRRSFATARAAMAITARGM
jgi:hypothetical protein